MRRAIAIVTAMTAAAVVVCGVAATVGAFNRPTAVAVKAWIAVNSEGSTGRVQPGGTYTHCATTPIVRLSIKGVGMRAVAGKQGSFRSIVARDDRRVLKSQILYWKRTERRNRFGLHYTRPDGFAEGRWTWSLVQRAGARRIGLSEIVLATDPSC